MKFDKQKAQAIRERFEKDKYNQSLTQLSEVAFQLPAALDRIEELEKALIEKQSIILHLEWLKWHASTGYSGKKEFEMVTAKVQDEYRDIAHEQLAGIL